MLSCKEYRCYPVKSWLGLNFTFVKFFIPFSLILSGKKKLKTARSHYHGLLSTSFFLIENFFVHLISKMCFFIIYLLSAVGQGLLRIHSMKQCCLNCYINRSLHWYVEQVARCLRVMEQSCIKLLQHWNRQVPLSKLCISRTSTFTRGFNVAVKNTSLPFRLTLVVFKWTKCLKT